MPILLVIAIEASLVAFFVFGYVLWRRNRRRGSVAAGSTGVPRAGG